MKRDDEGEKGKGIKSEYYDRRGGKQMRFYFFGSLQ
jgi:hypothetical protein